MAIPVESFHSQDLEVVVARLEAVLAPVVEVGARRDSAGRALVLADGEELRESASTSDRRLIVARARADVVVAAVSINRA